MTNAVFVLGGILCASTLIGCASLGDEARDTFAKNFTCPEERVEVRERRAQGHPTVGLAQVGSATGRGCGRSGAPRDVERAASEAPGGRRRSPLHFRGARLRSRVALLVRARFPRARLVPALHEARSPQRRRGVSKKLLKDQIRAFARGHHRRGTFGASTDRLSQAWGRAAFSDVHVEERHCGVGHRPRRRSARPRPTTSRAARRSARPSRAPTPTRRARASAPSPLASTPRGRAACPRSSARR